MEDSSSVRRRSVSPQLKVRTTIWREWRENGLTGTVTLGWREKEVVRGEKEFLLFVVDSDEEGGDEEKREGLCEEENACIDAEYETDREEKENCG